MRLKVRFKNPVFIAQLILSIFTPVLAYAGLTVQDLTTWKALVDLFISASIIRNILVIGGSDRTALLLQCKKYTLLPHDSRVSINESLIPAYRMY